MYSFADMTLHTSIPISHHNPCLILHSQRGCIINTDCRNFECDFDTTSFDSPTQNPDTVIFCGICNSFRCHMLQIANVHPGHGRRFWLCVARNPCKQTHALFPVARLVGPFPLPKVAPHHQTLRLYLHALWLSGTLPSLHRLYWKSLKIIHWDLL